MENTHGRSIKEDKKTHTITIERIRTQSEKYK